MDTTLAHQCTLFSNSYFFGVVATRQESSSGRQKSPRIQVVLPEDLCDRLASLAERESRTVSNMAKVIIQQGVEFYEKGKDISGFSQLKTTTEGFRSALEAQESRRLKGAPRRIRLNRPS